MTTASDTIAAAAQRKVVRVPMMRVVHVAVRVRQTLVQVQVRVQFGDVQPQARGHERKRRPEPSCF